MTKRQMDKLYREAVAMSPQSGWAADVATLINIIRKLQGWPVPPVRRPHGTS